MVKEGGRYPSNDDGQSRTSTTTRTSTMMGESAVGGRRSGVSTPAQTELRPTGKNILQVDLKESVLRSSLGV
jgi:hypothetical protein